ncbi:MAG: DUF4293 domain-containing protein [Prevotellaceae bacterium]|jgi:hypothetical protein|nr:DUF4293 domain-containing protein [Prevotellaceae bacterium]
MLQRIQSLFLLLAIGLETSLFFVPVWREGAAVHSVGALVWTNPPGLFPVGVCVLLLLSIGMAAVALFSYRRRIRQLRLCRWNMLVLIGFQVLMAWHSAAADNDLLTPTLFPTVAIALHWLALRYIRRDEALVRAADRLR